MGYRKDISSEEVVASHVASVHQVRDYVTYIQQNIEHLQSMYIEYLYRACSICVNQVRDYVNYTQQYIEHLIEYAVHEEREHVE